ncbi:hypothetical protein TeGR_g10445, partial [Tetraparma gracilis]
LVVQTSLAVYMGWLSEENFSSADFEQQENQASGWMETTQVTLFLCTALYSITHLFNSVVYWRASVTNLVDRLEGTVDPLEKLNKLPLAKRLMKWYNDNFSFRTAGKYSFVLIVGAEVTEFLVQMLRANELAAFLDWTDQKLYLTLIFTNFLVFGLCFLTPERYVSASVIITVDAIFDASYIMFNIFYVENPTSYWAIIVPLFKSAKALNNSVVRQAHDMVLHQMAKEASLKMFDESKARGTYPEDACLHLLRLLDSGSKNGRIEVTPPSGYDSFKPLLFLQKSEGAEVVTGILEFVVPGVTAGQAFTYFSRYSPDDRGTGEQAVLEVMSSDYRVVHGTPHPDPLNVMLALRDVCLDHVWTKLEYGDESHDAGVMFLDVMRSCERKDAPLKKGFVRADCFLGHKFENTPEGGTKITVLLFGDPRGNLPISICNFALKGQMKVRLESFKEHFVDHKNPDGSDNGGSWPDDERLYNFDGGRSLKLLCVCNSRERDMTRGRAEEAGRRPRQPVNASSGSGCGNSASGTSASTSSDVAYGARAVSRAEREAIATPDLGNLQRLEFGENPALGLLPKGLFSKLCSLTRYHGGGGLVLIGENYVTGLDVSVFANMTFAGWPYCEAVTGNPAARDMCEAQQGVSVEGSCADRGEGPER